MRPSAIVSTALGIALCMTPHLLRADAPSGPGEATITDLTRSGGMIRHLGVGFGFSDPGSDFVLLPKLGSAAGNSRAWGWESTATGERVVASVNRGAGPDAKAFREFIRGIRSSLSEGGAVESESVQTEQRPYVADFAVALPRGYAFDMRCLGLLSVDRQPSIVCVTTVSLDHQTLAPIRESLRADHPDLQEAEPTKGIDSVIGGSGFGYLLFWALVVSACLLLNRFKGRQVVNPGTVAIVAFIVILVVEMSVVTYLLASQPRGGGFHAGFTMGRVAGKSLVPLLLAIWLRGHFSRSNHALDQRAVASPSSDA